MPFADLCKNFIKIKLALLFLHKIVHISNSTEFTNFIFGKNIQQHKIHQMITSFSVLFLSLGLGDQKIYNHDYLYTISEIEPRQNLF